jgi:hypothetical protein
MAGTILTSVGLPNPTFRTGQAATPHPRPDRGRRGGTHNAGTDRLGPEPRILTGRIGFRPSRPLASSEHGHPLRRGCWAQMPRSRPPGAALAPRPPGTILRRTAWADPPPAARPGDPAAGTAPRSRRRSSARGRFSAPYGASPSILGRCRRPIPHNRYRQLRGIRPRREGRTAPLPPVPTRRDRARAGITRVRLTTHEARPRTGRDHPPSGSRDGSISGQGDGAAAGAGERSGPSGAARAASRGGTGRVGAGTEGSPNRRPFGSRRRANRCEPPKNGADGPAVRLIQ